MVTYQYGISGMVKGLLVFTQLVYVFNKWRGRSVCGEHLTRNTVINRKGGFRPRHTLTSGQTQRNKITKNQPCQSDYYKYVTLLQENKKTFCY